MLFLIIIILGTILGYVYLSPTEPTVTIDQLYNVTESGQTILVNISITNVPSCLGWVFDISWDPHILRITTGDENGLKVGNTYYNIYEGPFLKNVRSTVFLANSINNEAGKIGQLSAGYLSTDGTPSGSGLLVSINFTVIHTGTTTIEITGPSEGKGLVADSANQPIAHKEVYGLITMNASPPPWTQIGFQTVMITFAVEIIVLIVASYIVIRVKHPKPKKAEEEAEGELEP